MVRLSGRNAHEARQRIQMSHANLTQTLSEQFITLHYQQRSDDRLDEDQWCEIADKYMETSGIRLQPGGHLPPQQYR